MPRKGPIPKREILPDPLFKDLVVAKFINNLMNDGKKSLAESIFYSSIEKIKEDQIEPDFDSALKLSKRRRIGALRPEKNPELFISVSFLNSASAVTGLSLRD